MVLAGNKAKRLSSISHTTKTIYQFTPKLISRIGRSEDNKKKPIKVELQKELDKEKILNKLRNLKSNIEYKGISITEDYTTSERQMLKHSNSNWVGFLIRVDPNIIVNEKSVSDPRIIAVNLEIRRFNVRLVNVYSTTESDSSENKKNSFYMLLNKACQTRKT